MAKAEHDEFREKVSPDGYATSNSSRHEVTNDIEHMQNAHLPLPKTADDFDDPEDLEVDDATERKILAKLDRRIIPMVVWIYLMNMMDRGRENELENRLARIKANPSSSQHRCGTNSGMLRRDTLLNHHCRQCSPFWTRGGSGYGSGER